MCQLHKIVIHYDYLYIQYSNNISMAWLVDVTTFWELLRGSIAVKKIWSVGVNEDDFLIFVTLH